MLIESVLYSNLSMLCDNKLMLLHTFMFIPTIKLKDKHIQLKDEETEIGTYN